MLREILVVQFAAINVNLVSNGFGFAFANFPVAKTGANRADTELAVNAPRLRVAAVLRVIKNRNVPPVFATGDLHADVEPHGALALGGGVDIPRGIDGLAFRAGFPRHTQEQSAVIVFADSDIGLRLAAPLEVEDMAVAVGAHRPTLRLGQHRVAVGVEQVVHRLPLHRLALGLEYVHGFALPVIIGGMMEIVAAVHAGEAPVQAGLMPVMTRAVLSEHAVAIWPDNRVQVGSMMSGGVLRDQRLGQAVTVDGDRPGTLVEPGLERGSGGGGSQAKRGQRRQK